MPWSHHHAIQVYPGPLAESGRFLFQFDDNTAQYALFPCIKVTMSQKCCGAMEVWKLLAI